VLDRVAAARAISTRPAIGRASASHPGPRSRPRTGQSASKPARAELPRARLQKVEGGLRRHDDGAGVHREARRDGGDQPEPDDRDTAAPRLEENHQDERPDEVELLLDAQRPRLQQRHGRRRGIEVPGVVEEEAVGGGAERPQHAARHLPIVSRQQQQPAAGEHEHDQYRQRRDDASHASLVERGQRVRSGSQLAQQEPGDQEAGDDEEHVHADESAAHPSRRVEVERDR